MASKSSTTNPILYKNITYKDVEIDIQQKTVKPVDTHILGWQYTLQIIMKCIFMVLLFCLVAAASLFNRWSILDLMTVSLKTVSQNPNDQAVFQAATNNGNVSNVGFIFDIHSVNTNGTGSGSKSSGESSDGDIFTPYFYAILSLLLIPEGITFLIYISRWITKSESDISIFEVIIHFSPIFFLDVLSAISSTWYLFMIYISSPSYLNMGIMMSALWLPSVISLVESIYYKCSNEKFNLKDVLIDSLAVVFNTITFALTLGQYLSSNLLPATDSTFQIVCLFFCPLFQFTNLIYTWFHGVEYFFTDCWRPFSRKQKVLRKDFDIIIEPLQKQIIVIEENEALDNKTKQKEIKELNSKIPSDEFIRQEISRCKNKYSPKYNRSKISVISSLTKMITMVITLFSTQAAMTSQVFSDETLYQDSTTYLWANVLIIICTGFIITWLTFTSIEIGGYSHFLPLGLAPMCGNLAMILTDYFSCSLTEPYPNITQAENWANDQNGVNYDPSNTTVTTAVYFVNGITCWTNNSGGISYLACTLIYIFVGLPGWMMTCRHIYAKTPIQFLKYSDLFSTGAIFSAVGSVDLMITINRRRNNLNIADLQIKQNIEEQMRRLSLMSRTSFTSRRQTLLQSNLNLAQSNMNLNLATRNSELNATGSGLTYRDAKNSENLTVRDLRRQRDKAEAKRREAEGLPRHGSSRKKVQRGVTFRQTGDDTSAFDSDSSDDIKTGGLGRNVSVRLQSTNTCFDDEAITYREQSSYDTNRDGDDSDNSQGLDPDDTGSQDQLYKVFDYKDKVKKPYIYFCPTLYQEDEDEIKTLVTSILRCNRHRINLAELNNGETKFDFEVNIMFDNCFVNRNYRIPDETLRSYEKDEDGCIKEEDLIEDRVFENDTTGLDFTFRHINVPEKINRNVEAATIRHMATTRGTTRNQNGSATEKTAETKAQTFEAEEKKVIVDEPKTIKIAKKCEKGKSKEIVESFGLYYKLREINEHVKFLLKTMHEVAETVPFSSDPILQKEEHNQIDPPIISFWPYGIRLEYFLPMKENMDIDTAVKISKVPFTVHLKDPELIQKGKRWSQTMYFNYLLGYKCRQQDKTKPEHEQMQNRYETMFLALDGDIDFWPDALMNCIAKLQAQKKVGVVCGKIHPKGSWLNPMLYYQQFEYAVGHWFQKASEHIFGSVLCSPGCFSLMRGDSLIMNVNGELDSAIDVYAAIPTKENPLDIIQWNQGEDRWLCTLLIKRGWRIKYVAISHQDTNAPMSMKEFFNQRRRWGPSTLFNIFDIIKNWALVTRMNDSVSGLFLVYIAVVNLSSLLTASTVSLMLLGSFQLLLQTWGCFFCEWTWLPYVLTFGPPIIFALICYLSVDDNPKHATVGVLTWFYSMTMLGVLVVLIGSMIAPCGICILTYQLFLIIVALYFIAALLNPLEFLDLVAGIVYWLFLPTMLILLNIYMYFGLNNTSWGTRESDAQIKIDDLDEKGQARWNCLCGTLCRFQCLLTQPKEISEDEKAEIIRKRLLQKKRKDFEEYAELKEDKILVFPCHKNPNTFSSKEKLMVPIEYNITELLNEKYNIDKNCVTDYPDSMYPGEQEYWTQFIKEKLFVQAKVETSKEDGPIIRENLLNLRNQFAAFFVFINSFWVVALLTISILSSDYEISVSGIGCGDYYVQNGTKETCHHYDNGTTGMCHTNTTYEDCGTAAQMNPLSLLYLIFYVSIMSIQSIGMIIHRWESFVVYCSAVSVSDYFAKHCFCCFNKCKSEQYFLDNPEMEDYYTYNNEARRLETIEYIGTAFTKSIERYNQSFEERQAELRAKKSKYREYTFNTKSEEKKEKRRRKIALAEDDMLRKEAIEREKRELTECAQNVREMELAVSGMELTDYPVTNLDSSPIPPDYDSISHRNGNFVID